MFREVTVFCIYLKLTHVSSFQFRALNSISHSHIHRAFGLQSVH